MIVHCAGELCSLQPPFLVLKDESVPSIGRGPEGWWATVAAVAWWRGGSVWVWTQERLLVWVCRPLCGGKQIQLCGGNVLCLVGGSQKCPWGKMTDVSLIIYYTVYVNLGDWMDLVGLCLSPGTHTSATSRHQVRLVRWARDAPPPCCRVGPCPRHLPWHRRWWRTTWLYTHS